MKRIINCAHRGAMAYEPENSLRAFRRAAEMGADQIELDVFLTEDKVPVICHSSILKAEPHGGNVRKMKYSEVKELLCHGEHIPTLQESIDVCNETGMQINIEIKDRESVGVVVEAVQKNNLYGRCQVSNFHIGVLTQVKRADARIALGYISIPFLQKQQLRIAAANKCESINPVHKVVNRAYVEKAHGMGVKVFVWTLNEEKDMRRMIEVGVDGIITNKPDILTRIKKEMGIE